MPTESTHTSPAVDMQELVRSHQSLVARVLTRAGVAQRDVPDLVQEVFIVAHRRLPEWQGRAKLSTWLYRVALRVASDHRRRAYQRRETLPGLDTAALEAPTSELSELERREQILQLCAALDQLSDEHKQALVGYDIEELSVAELAARTQVPHKTVYSRLYAARRQLRLLLLAQGWTLLGQFMWGPRRCLAAWRGLGLPLAPLACCLLLLTPALPSPPSAAAPSAPRDQNVKYAAPAEPSLPPTLLPAAAPARKRKRVSQLHAASQATAPSQPIAPQAGLKVIHIGSVERPEGQLPFGFERVAERPAPRLSLRGPRDPVDGLMRELL